MTETQSSGAKDRLQACGVSICHCAGTEADGKGHLLIQTSGYDEIDLAKALPILHDLVETFDLEFLGPVTDDDLQHLVGLRNILSLKLNKTITDAGLRHLAGLSSLRVLELWGLPVTTAGIKHLTGLVKLSALNLINTQVNDEGMEALAKLTELTWLNLSGCPITDLGLEPSDQTDEAGEPGPGQDRNPGVRPGSAGATYGTGNADPRLSADN